MTLLYRIGRSIAYLVRLYYPLKIMNRECIPKQGPVVLIINHRIWYDVVPVVHSLRRQVFFISKAENFKNKLFAWFLTSCGCFPIHRGTADLPAMRYGISLLKEGKVLGIFPEGTRNRTDQTLQTFHEGASLFALNGKATAVPIFLGDFRAFHRTPVLIGQPLDLSQWRDRPVNRVILNEVTGLIVHEMQNLVEIYEKMA